MRRIAILNLNVEQRILGMLKGEIVIGFIKNGK